MNLIFIALDKSDDEVLLDEELFTEKYIFSSNEPSFEHKFINNENFYNLINFIFQTDVIISNVKSSGNRKLINLSLYKDKYLHPNDLEIEYFKWLDISKNENTMTEYGSLICVLGYLESNKNKNKLYLIVE